MATRSAPLLLAHYLLHDNPYQAPQSDKLAQASAERPAKRRAIHSPLRGAIIGAITGGVPLLALIVIDALISYGRYAENDDLQQYWGDKWHAITRILPTIIALAFLGALVGAGIVATAKWLQAHRSPTQP